MSLYSEIVSILSQQWNTLSVGVAFFLALSTLVAAVVVSRGRYLYEKSTFKATYGSHGNLVSMIKEERFIPRKALGIKEQVMLAMLEDKNADNSPPVRFVRATLLTD